MRAAVTVDTIEEAAQDRAVATHVMAFSADPVMRWIYPDPHDYLRHFPRFVRAFGGRAFDNDAAYSVADFGGVSLWFPPGVHADGDAVVALFSETLDKPLRSEVFAVLEEMDRHHIDEPHWYLPIIGVDPSRQGEGLGSGLLQHTNRECDDKGVPAYLESSNPRNVPFYQRHGFEAVAEIRIGSAPVVTPMLRRAKPR